MQTADTEITQLRSVIAERGIMELSAPYTISVPGRWLLQCGKMSRAEAEQELDGMAETLVKSIRAVAGLYLRMCDFIRATTLTEYDVRKILARHFPPSRVSEIIRVAHAPPEVYSRYSSGLMGFKPTLRATRLYRITETSELKRRKIKHAAARLATLVSGPFETRVRDVVIKVQPV